MPTPVPAGNRFYPSQLYQLFRDHNHAKSAGDRAYAVWSGAGIVLISAAGWLLFGQVLDAAAIVGLVLIVAGVLVVNLLSGSVHR